MYVPLVIDPMRPAPQPGLPQLSDVARAASVIAGVPLQWLSGRSKETDIVLARWLYYSVAKRLGHRVTDIGRVVNRTHSSVIHGLIVAGINNPEFHAKRALVVAVLSAKFPELEVPRD